MSYSKFKSILNKNICYDGLQDYTVENVLVEYLKILGNTEDVEKSAEFYSTHVSNGIDEDRERAKQDYIAGVNYIINQFLNRD